MRKFLLTFVVLVAGAMSAWAQVAKIGDVPYATLAEAVSAAENGATITVQSDVTLDATLVVPAGKTITLDLNGKTISQEKFCSASYEMILNKGNLTITGNGKLSFKDTSAGDSSFGWGSYTLRNEGTLVVENGTIEHLGEQTFATHMICAIFQYSGSTTINGGTISTPNYRSVRLWKGDMTINGGTFEGQVWVQSVDDSAVLTVNGGTFAPRGRDGSSVFVGNVTAGGVHHTAGFSVTGGIFTTKIGCSDAAKLEGDLITGGNFSETAKENTNSSLFADDIVFDNPVDGYYNAWSPEEVRYINDLDEFLAFRDEVNSGVSSFAGVIVRLNVDLNFNELDWTENIGNAEHPFEGIFDGQGKSIKNLYFASRPGVARDYLGLFGVISGGAVIKNVVLEDLYFVPGGGGQYVGTVVGYASNGVTIQGNVVNKLKVEGTEYVGGLVGYASNDVVIVGNTVQNLTVQGKISVGAIAGKILAGAEVVDNTIVDVLVSALGDENTAAVVAGTFEDGVIISGTIQDGVKVNGAENTNPVSTAAKVGNAYYLTLDAAATDGENKEIEVVLFGKHTLADDVSYEHTNTVTVNGDLTYTRKLTENWNPLYLPFEYEFDAAKYDVAEFTSADGTTLTLTHVEGINVLEANKAYVIRPKSEEARNLEINLDTKTLKAATTNIIDLNNGYSVKGNNIKYSGADFRTEFGDYSLVVGTNGKWGKLKETSTLKPFRLILTIPSGAGAVSMRFVKGTTVVEEVELDMQQAEAIFDLSGRRVETMTEGGVYIVNGKKVIF